MPLYNIHVFASNNFQRALAATLYGHEKYSNNIDFLTFLWRKSFFFIHRVWKNVNYAKDWLNLLFFFPGLETMDVITIIQCSQQPFFSVLSHFRHADKQKNEQTTKRATLEQACSWPVRRKSFAIGILKLTTERGLNQKSRGKVFFCFACPIVNKAGGAVKKLWRDWREA